VEMAGFVPNREAIAERLPGVQIDVLGPFSVRVDGRAVASREFGGRLARRLVRVLAASPGRVVTRDVLIEALWGADRPADPDANLNVLVNRARKALCGAIETTDRGYRLPAAVIVDADLFEDSVAAGDGEVALSLWHGEPLPQDAYEEWAQPVRHRLERRHQDALELAAAAALAAGSSRRAADLAAEAVEHAPLREAAHLLLVRALAAGGDQAAALAAYERLRALLTEELGIDPSREAAALHERLLLRTELEPAVEAGSGAFVGRDQELTTLCRLNPLTVLAGPSGSGKSRLLTEAKTRVRQSVIRARAVLPEQEAPWSLACALLRAAAEQGADLAALPGRTRAAVAALLADGEASDVDPQSWRALLLNGGGAMLQDAVIMVDDLQWADSSSVDLLRVVIDRGSARAVVLAYRPEAVPPNSPVAVLLAELSDRATHVRLGALDPVAVRRLVLPQEVADVIAQETDGTPYAVLAVVRDVGAVARADRWQVTGADAVERARAAARAGQRRAIMTRMQRQPSAAQEILALLALLGRPTSATLLADATDRHLADVLTTLVDLAGAGLVRHDSHGFATAHDLVAETIREQLDEVSRARLHQLLAGSLADSDGPADELARHLAGAGDIPAASTAFAAAAADRLRSFAHDEAAQLAEEGLALGPAGIARLSLLEVRAETHVRRNDPAAAREDLRLAVAMSAPGARRSRLLARLARLATGADDMRRAAGLVEMALAEAGNDPAAQADALYTAALIDMNTDQQARAQSRLVEALTLFEQLGNSRGVADILDSRAMTQFLDGDVGGALDAFSHVDALFLDIGDLLRVVTPRSMRGHALVFAGKPEEGLPHNESALELAQSLGHADGEAFALWQRSEALSALGRVDEAVASATTARVIAQRLGHGGWTAMALRALGIALRAGGDLSGAEEAFRGSLEASEHVRLFISWAHAQLALVLVDRGAFKEATQHVTKALSEGPPLAHFEARLAACLLSARGYQVPGAPDRDTAITMATQAGHGASLTALLAL
jgi:DNA-binding SARP family transcriptional activator